SNSSHTQPCTTTNSIPSASMIRIGSSTGSSPLSYKPNEYEFTSSSSSHRPHIRPAIGLRRPLCSIHLESMFRAAFPTATLMVRFSSMQLLPRYPESAAISRVRKARFPLVLPKAPVVHSFIIVAPYRMSYAVLSKRLHTLRERMAQRALRRGRVLAEAVLLWKKRRRAHKPPDSKAEERPK